MALDYLQDDPSAMQAGQQGDVAPALTPVYSGECLLGLSTAAASGAFVQDPALAIDGDAATCATFPAETNQSGQGWQPADTVLTVAGAGKSQVNGAYPYNSTGAGYRGGQGGSCSIVYQANGSVWILSYGNQAYYQGGSAQGPTSQYGAWSVVPSAPSDAGAPPTVTAATSGGQPVPGPPPFPANATARFLKVDWGGAGSLGDRFLTRIRLLVGGDGAANGAVAFLSALGEIESGQEVDVVLPLWADNVAVAGSGGADIEVHEIALDVPPYARGLIYYPDFLSPVASFGPAGSVPIVNLYEFMAYEACTRSATTMPASSKKRARVGVSSVKIYPWNDTTGPYDDTVASVLLGLSSLGITKNVKTAKVTGGETTHQIAAFETERETKVKVSAAVTDVNALHIILGGAYVVDPANANGGEVQYFAENIDDRAPYFRLIAVSSNGDGKDSFVFVKMKVDGNVSFQMDKDKVTELEFEAACYFDTSYTRQDGTIGGVYEQLFGSKGDTAMHS